MSTYTASPQSNPNEIKKNHAGKFIAVGLIATVAVIIIIIASGTLSMSTINNSNPNGGNNPKYAPTPHTESVISGSIVVNPDGYYFTGFSVPEDASNPVLQGNFTSAGNSTNNNAVVTVWSQKDFINYLNCQQSTPCYNKDLMPMVNGNINIPLSSGNYFIVFSSASIETKTVSAQIDLTYSKQIF
jgi:hypothetical protein